MTRPFFSRDRISHFELFDRHAGKPTAHSDALPYYGVTSLSRRGSAGQDERTHSRRLRHRFPGMHNFSSTISTYQQSRAQDLVSRFTLDSATEFLFGACVHSLRSTLPFPHNVSASSPFAATAASLPEKMLEQPEAFASAFAKAEHLCAERATQGKLWPLWEMRKDKSRQYTSVVDAYLHPILEEALAKKARREREENAKRAEEADDIEDGETLLDHLVKYTSGEWRRP